MSEADTAVLDEATHPIFVDTNILVYARDARDPRKHDIAKDWLRTLWSHDIGRTGMQVLNDFFVTVTRKLKPGLDPSVAWADVLDLLSWEPQAVDRAWIEYAHHINARFSPAWWDSLIVSAARLQGCSAILSEDLQSGADYDGVRVGNPFEL